MTGLGRKERYSETGPQNEKEQQLLLLSRTLSPPKVESRRPQGDLRPAPFSSVSLPLLWPFPFHSVGRTGTGEDGE